MAEQSLLYCLHVVEKHLLYRRKTKNVSETIKKECFFFRLKLISYLLISISILYFFL